MFDIFCTYPYGLSLNGWHALLCIANNRHGVTITTHAIKRHLLIWMTTVRQPTKRRRSRVLTLKYTFICVYWWTTQRIHNTSHISPWQLKYQTERCMYLFQSSIYIMRIRVLMLHEWFELVPFSSKHVNPACISDIIVWYQKCFQKLAYILAIWSACKIVYSFHTDDIDIYLFIFVFIYHPSGSDDFHCIWSSTSIKHALFQSQAEQCRVIIRNVDFDD